MSIDKAQAVGRHFILGEFFNPNDRWLDDHWMTGPVTHLARIKRLCVQLDLVWEHFNSGKWALPDGRKRRVTITSGGRSPQHNAEIPGAAPKSQHMNWEAADFDVEGVPTSEVSAFCRTLPGLGGVGHYATWTHADVRDRGPGGALATWEG